MAAAAPDPGEQSLGTVVFIQYLRATAPILVLWAHLAGFWLWAHNRGWTPYAFWTDNVAGPFDLYQNAGHLGVVMFFLVSGYIVTYTSMRETGRDFLIKRVFRLAPALWASVAVVALARFIAHEAGVGYPIGTGGDGFVSFLRGAFLLDMIQHKTQINGVTWTLVIEVIFYLLTGFAIALTRRVPAVATLVMLAAWAILALSLHHFAQTHYFDTYTPYVGLLILGRCFMLYDRRQVSVRLCYLLCGVVAAVSVGVYAHVLPGVLHSLGGPANTYLLAVMIFLVFMFAKPTGSPWVIRKLSDISYSLYLLHIPVGILTIDLVMKASDRFTIAFLSGVAASLAASYVSYRLVELPSQRAARNLIRTLRRRRAARAIQPAHAAGGDDSALARQRA